MAAGYVLKHIQSLCFPTVFCFLMLQATLALSIRPIICTNTTNRCSISHYKDHNTSFSYFDPKTTSQNLHFNLLFASTSFLLFLAYLHQDLELIMETIENKSESMIGMMIGKSVGYMRRFLFRIIACGPIPQHIAFILDGNRRYAKKWNLAEGMGHRAGFLSLMSLMRYCYELGIKYITIYAFSIDNFRRKPHEVRYVMDLMLEKIEGMLKEEGIVRQYGVRVYFIGNLSLLEEKVRKAAENAMKVTEDNNRCILLICVAYTSTDEITHSAQECCAELWNHQIIDESKKQYQTGGTVSEIVSEEEENEVEREKVRHESQNDRGEIKLSDIEKRLYMGVAPDVDILVRTSGETRLSNFLLWQTWNGLLYSPKALWPEIGLPHLVFAVLNFQRAYPIFEKRKKQC